MVFVKPASVELVVRDPVTFSPVPVEGRWVEDSQYWTRRVQDGSLVLGTAEPEPSKKSQQRTNEGGT